MTGLIGARTGDRFTRPEWELVLDGWRAQLFLQALGHPASIALTEIVGGIAQWQETALWCDDAWKEVGR